MDLFSQGALGAACSQVVLNKYSKYYVWLVGGISGMAADLDVLIRSNTDPMLSLIYHRHFTHALSFIPLGGLLVALAFLPFKRFRQHWRITLLAAIIGYATHGLLDACTSYGTVLLWPFSEKRIAWDIISIIDPFFTFPLILGLVWTLVFKSRKGVIAGLFVAGSLLIFNSWQHHRALTMMDTYARQQHLNLTKVRAFPALGSSTHWRVAAYTNKHWLIANVSTPLLQNGVVSVWGYFPAFHQADLPGYVYRTGQQFRDFSVFDWFTDGYLITTSKQPLVLVDARYLSGPHPVFGLWGIEFNPNKFHVQRLRSISLEDTSS